MKIIVCPDSFKGTLSPAMAARAIARGLRQGIARFLSVNCDSANPLPDGFPPCADAIEIIEHPLADGGEGSLEVLTAAGACRRAEISVTGPLGERIRAGIGLSADNSTAWVEMASIAGLCLVPPGFRNPLATTTAGVGEAILAAMGLGATKVIVLCGGSATCDCGIGALAALGVVFRDSFGKAICSPHPRHHSAGFDPITPGTAREYLTGADLERICAIDATCLAPGIARTRIVLACDVKNPLCGPVGAARMYAPQKGADPGGTEALARGAENFARIAGRDLGVAVGKMAHGGAAGGLPAGFLALSKVLPAGNAPTAMSGAHLIADDTGLAGTIAGAGLVVTGEGRLDAQTRWGKAPAVVSGMCRSLTVPVIAICGQVDPGSLSVGNGLFDALYACTPEESADSAGMDPFGTLSATSETAGFEWAAEIAARTTSKAGSGRRLTQPCHGENQGNDHEPTR